MVSHIHSTLFVSVKLWLQYVGCRFTMYIL